LGQLQLAPSGLDGLPLSVLKLGLSAGVRQRGLLPPSLLLNGALLHFELPPGGIRGRLQVGRASGLLLYLLSAPLQIVDRLLAFREGIVLGFLDDTGESTCECDALSRQHHAQEHRH